MTKKLTSILLTDSPTNFQNNQLSSYLQIDFRKIHY